MQHVAEHFCSHCQFSLRSLEWRGRPYIVSADGERAIGPILTKVLPTPDKTEEGISRVEIKRESGFLSECLCLKCLKRFELDLERDKRQCEHCGSTDIKPVGDLMNGRCPKCKVGFLQKTLTGASLNI
jgi:hypothetical protein